MTVTQMAVILGSGSNLQRQFSIKMDVQVISHWQRRLMPLRSLWFMNLPHRGRVVALIGNCIPHAKVSLLQNVIAV